MGGIVIEDSAPQPSSVYISWRDERTTEKVVHGGSYVDEVRVRLGESCIVSLGNELKPGSTLALLYWLNQNHRMNTIARGAWLVFGHLGSDWFFDSAFERRDRSLGSSDQGMEPRGIRAFGLRLERFPNHSKTFESIGTMQIGNRELEVFPAVGDHPCSLLGVGVEEGELSVNVSTGSQVSLFSKELRLGPWQTRFACLDGYLNTLTHLPAGRALDGLFGLVHQLSSLPPAEAWNRIRMMVEEDEVACDDLEVKLSFFEGPMGKSRRGFEHSFGQSVDRLFVSGGVSKHGGKLRDLCSAFGSQRSCSQVVLSGGLTQRFPYLREQISHRLGMKIRETPEGDDALLGLLRLAKCVGEPAERRCV